MSEVDSTDAPTEAVSHEHEREGEEGNTGEGRALDAIFGEQAGVFKGRFEAEKNLLSFGEYMEVFAEQADAQVRDTARYVRDCFLYYGTAEVHRPYGSFTRFLLFDCPFDEGRDPLVAQEAVQNAVYGHLNDFAVHGRVNRMVVLAGPNGSAKSRFISCLMRALED